MKRLLQPRHLFPQSTPSTQRILEPSRCRHLSTLHNLSMNHLQQPQRKHNPTANRTLESHQKRTFLSSFLPSQLQQKPTNNSSNGGGNGNSNSRILTASRTLPYGPATLFTVISSVESYSDFLPFLTASTVTARDKETGYPAQAYLTVGYGPLSETFTSKVDCDPARWVVEARSGGRFAAATGKEERSGLGALASFAGADEGIFEYLSTRWELVPESISSGGGGERTTVKLEIRFEFKNQLYATMMSAVEGQMAGVMIEAFERRIKEVHGR